MLAPIFSISFDVVVAEPRSEALKRAVEREWTELLLMQIELEKQERAAMDRITTSPAQVLRLRRRRGPGVTPDASSPERALEVVKVVAVRTADGGEPLTDSHLLGLKVGYPLTLVAEIEGHAGIPVEMEVRGLQPDDLADLGYDQDSERKPVRVIRVPRFDLALFFPKIEESELPASPPGSEQQQQQQQQQQMQMQHADLREEISREFWDIFSLTATAESHFDLTKLSLETVWRSCPPSFLSLPFTAPLALRSGEQRPDALGEAVSATVLSVATSVPANLRPIEWRPSGAPFDIVEVRVGERSAEGARAVPVWLTIKGAENPVGIVKQVEGELDSSAVSTDKLNGVRLFKGVIRVFAVVGTGAGGAGSVMSLRLSSAWDALDAMGALEKVRKQIGSDAPLERRAARLRVKLLQLIKDRFSYELHTVGLVTRGVKSPRGRDVLLIGAPNSVLERRAEALGLEKLVAPRGDGGFTGGFRPGMFLKGGPVQPFFRSTPSNPHLYSPYFARPNADDPASVFTPAERLRLVLSQIEAPASVFDPALGTRVPAAGGAALDLRELKMEGVVDDVVFLHDTEEMRELAEVFTLTTLDAGRARDYFGDKVAFYFVFLQAYTWFLLFPGLLGLLSFLFAGSVMIEWFQGSTGKKGIPTDARLLVAYAFLIALGATIFLEIWKRRSSYFCHIWGLNGSGAGDDSSSLSASSSSTTSTSSSSSSLSRSVPRPEFVDFMRTGFAPRERAMGLLACLKGSGAGAVTDSQIAEIPATARAFSEQALVAEMDAHPWLLFYPPVLRSLKVFASFVICLVPTAVLAAVVYGIFVSGSSGYSQSPGRKVGIGIASGLGIPLLNALYKLLAVRLTNWEVHRTDQDFDASLFQKLFIFRFVNGYASLFCIAFISRDMKQLAIQLASILITGTIINNLIEIGGPYARRRFAIYRRNKAREAAAAAGQVVAGGDAADDVIDPRVDPKSYAEQAELEVVRPLYDTIAFSEDYIELVLQFGYATFFVVAFPMAPLIAFANNVVEFRVDAGKLQRLLRRPLPGSSRGIGSWLFTLEFMALVSIIFNVALVGVTDPTRLGLVALSLCGQDTSAFPCRGQSDLVWLIVLFEHILIFVKAVIMVVIGQDSSAVVKDRHTQSYYALVEEKSWSSNAESEFQEKKKKKDVIKRK